MNHIRNIFSISMVCAGFLFPFFSHAAEKDDVMLVLDVSGSMWGKVEGRTKIEIAREALKNLIKDWPADRNVGLMAYGHRSKGDCNDIEEILPVGIIDKQKLGMLVDGLTPKGMTPLSASVKKAAQALKFSEKKATVILISDGVETCDLDPCGTGEELEKLGVDFTAHVIGFDVLKIDQQKGLKCLAQNTGGQFISAANARELNEALSKAVEVQQPQPTAEPTVVPLPKVMLISPESAVKGTEISLNFSGESNPGGWVYLYKKGSEQHLKYSSVVKDGPEIFVPTKMRLPAEVGDYELRWKTTEEKLLATNQLKITEADVKLDGPSEAISGTEVELSITAPPGLDGYAHLYRRGKPQSISYQAVRESPQGGYEKLKMRMPVATGDFDIRWLGEGDKELATHHLALVAPQVSISAPDEVIKATEFKVTISAPPGLDGYIYLYTRGKDNSITYSSVRELPEGGYNQPEIMAPAFPGDYELKWRSGREEILAETAFKIIDAQISLKVPTEIYRATEISVETTGPEGLTGYIYLYAKGKDKQISYAYVRANPAPQEGYAPTRVVLPARAGDYELVFKTNQNEVIAKTEIKVLDAEYKISTAPEIDAEALMEIIPQGPVGAGGNVYFYRQGSEKHINSRAVREGKIDDYEKISAKAPKEPGEYLLKWITQSDEVLAEFAFVVK